jgi:hypothetical protein
LPKALATDCRSHHCSNSRGASTSPGRRARGGLCCGREQNHARRVLLTPEEPLRSYRATRSKAGSQRKNFDWQGGERDLSRLRAGFASAEVSQMPEIWTGFLAEFDRLKIKLPLKLSAYDIGDVIDSNGRHLCICDVNCERSDQEAVAIAACIVRAINSYAATVQRQGMSRSMLK